MRRHQASITTGDFAELDGHPYCRLTSFRRDGTAVDTPVWFAVANDRLYIKTDMPSGKVRRIRNDARVRIAPCTALGRALGRPVDALACEVASPSSQVAAEHALRLRYGLGRRLFALVVVPIFHLQVKTPVYLEVAPANGAGAS